MNPIKLVARKPFHFGDRHLVPPPEGSEGRASAYVIAVELSAAKTLVQSGIASPAFPDDAIALRRVGVFCRERFRLSESDVEAIESTEAVVAPAEPEEADSDDLSALVMDAIDSGLKADLVAALEAVGLEPEDYSNNAERGEALGLWLEEQGE